ncbi:hypothetical protein DL771_009594 [Monosporascus sp. 5C6A]|nr:hypothetical protein DL771_009594 [Monosporascus sp. 5C6A]
MHCKAYCGQQACPLVADMYGYCSEHFKQERGLYHYYKAHEQMYYQSRHDDCDEALERKHQHITLAIQARQLHTDWFFHDNRCDSHEHHVLGLMYDQGLLQRGIFDSGRGYIGADINETTRARLEEAVLRVGSDWQGEQSRIFTTTFSTQDHPPLPHFRSESHLLLRSTLTGDLEENVCGRHGDMPAIQIVPPDTPGARYAPRPPELVNWEDFEVPEDSPWPDWCDEPAVSSGTESWCEEFVGEFDAERIEAL